MLGLGIRAMQVPSVVFVRDDGEIVVGEAAEQQGDRRAVASGPRVQAAHRRLGAAWSSEDRRSRRRRCRRGCWPGWSVSPPSARAVRPSTCASPTRPTGARSSATCSGRRSSWPDCGARVRAPAPNRRPRPSPTRRGTAWTRATGSRCTTWAAAPSTRRCSSARARGFRLLGPPEGVEHLGGIDFDEAVFRHVLTALGDDVAGLDDTDPATATALARLRRDCVEAKEALSFERRHGGRGRPAGGHTGRCG